MQVSPGMAVLNPSSYHHALLQVCLQEARVRFRDRKDPRPLVGEPSAPTVRLTVHSLFAFSKRNVNKRFWTQLKVCESLTINYKNRQNEPMMTKVEMVIIFELLKGT